MDEKANHNDHIFGIYRNTVVFVENVNHALEEVGSTFTSLKFGESFVSSGQTGADDPYCRKCVLQQLQRLGVIKSGGRGRPYVIVGKLGAVRDVSDVALGADDGEAEIENISTVGQEDVSGVTVKQGTQNKGTGNNKQADVDADKQGIGSASEPAPKAPEQSTGIDQERGQEGSLGLVGKMEAMGETLARWGKRLYIPLVCLLIILAQMAINGYFAYTLGSGNLVSQYTYIAIMVGIDLSRPVYMYRGLASYGVGRKKMAIFYFFIGLIFGLASYGISANMLSASLANGVFLVERTDQNRDKFNQLEGEVTESKEEAADLEDGATIECRKGGCGNKAAALRLQAARYKKSALEKRQEADKLEAEIKEPPTMEERLAHAISTMPILGSNGGVFLPYLLAAVMEIATTFGVALLWRKD